MKKLIFLILIILLWTAVVYPYEYKLDDIIVQFKESGKIVALNSEIAIIFLEFQTNTKEVNHDSYYISLFIQKIEEDTFILIKLAFIKEEWLLINNVWNISRYIASDEDMNASTNQYQCSKLKETKDGIILSLEKIDCPLTEQKLIEEVISNTNFKIKL